MSGSRHSSIGMVDLDESDEDSFTQDVVEQQPAVLDHSVLEEFKTIQAVQDEIQKRQISMLDYRHFDGEKHAAAVRLNEETKKSITDLKAALQQEFTNDDLDLADEIAELEQQKSQIEVNQKLIALRIRQHGTRLEEIEQHTVKFKRMADNIFSIIQRHFQIKKQTQPGLIDGLLISANFKETPSKIAQDGIYAELERDLPVQLFYKLLNEEHPYKKWSDAPLKTWTAMIEAHLEKIKQRHAEVKGMLDAEEVNHAAGDAQILQVMTQINELSTVTRSELKSTSSQLLKIIADLEAKSKQLDEGLVKCVEIKVANLQKALDTYLEERNKEYKHSDNIKRAAVNLKAALNIHGVFGEVKDPEYRRRRTYIQTLKSSLDTYAKCGEKRDLLEVLTWGVEAFKPRASDESTDEYQQSLACLLQKMVKTLYLHGEAGKLQKKL